MKNKNIRKRLWCLLASCVSFVPSSKAMKTETSVDPSGYEASDEASDSDYNDFISKLNESKKKEKPREKKVPVKTTEEEAQRPTFLGLLSRIDKLDLATIGLPTLWWLTGGRPVTTGWNKLMHNVDFFDSKYRRVMFRDVKGFNMPSRGHNISIGDTFRYTYGPAPISKEEKDSWKSKIKSGVKTGLSKAKNFITRKSEEELEKEEEANEKLEKELENDSKSGTCFVSCNGDTQIVNFKEFKEVKNNEINKVIVYAQCDDVFIVDIPKNIKYLTVFGANNVSISSDLTNLKYFEVHCRNLYLCPPYEIKKGVVKATKFEGNSNLVEAVFDIRGLFSLDIKRFDGLLDEIVERDKKEKLELDYGFKKMLRIDRNGNNNLPGFGKLKDFEVTGSLGEGNWLKFEKKNKEEAK